MNPGNDFLFDVDLMTSSDFRNDSKAHIETIDQFLKDQKRIETFKEFINLNKHIFHGRSVLNLNCSVGIYALFAANAGAAVVYAIDNSNVVDYTKRIVEANGYKDVIKVIKGKLEDIELPLQQVDIIISDWMGYALYHQSTLADIIYARDKWLKKSSGLIFPDVATLYIAAVEDKKDKESCIDWWRNVYGFNMSCIRKYALKEPKFKKVTPQQVLSRNFLIKTLDMNEATIEDFNFCSKYTLTMQRAGNMHGIVLYFRVSFSKCHQPLMLSTSPRSPITNWVQTVCYFDQSIVVKSDELYYGEIEFVVSSNQKQYDFNEITINYIMLQGDLLMAELKVITNWNMIAPHAMNFNKYLCLNTTDRVLEATDIRRTKHKRNEIEILLPSISSLPSNKNLIKVFKEKMEADNKEHESKEIEKFDNNTANDSPSLTTSEDCDKNLIAMLLSSSVLDSNFSNVSIESNTGNDKFSHSLSPSIKSGEKENIDYGKNYNEKKMTRQSL